MEGVPKRSKWSATTPFDFDDLKNRLREAQDNSSGEPRNLMRAYLDILWTYLLVQDMSKPSEDQDVPDMENLLKPLQNLYCGLMDLDQGFVRLDLFEPDRAAKHSIPVEDAVNKAKAAAAIKLAPRGEKAKYAEEAARRLGVNKIHLMEFQQNLSRGRIKSKAANDTYDWYVWMANQPCSGEKTGTALWLLSELEPLVTKRRHVE